MGANEPKYQNIKKALLEEVRHGNYLPGHSFITEREVCRNFGVSRITAVRALNDLVNEGILVRKQGRGTFVAGPSEAPVGGSGTIIGCVFHEIHGHHVMEMLTGIEKMCAERGGHLVLFDSASEPQREATNLRRARQLGVRGLIVYPVEGSTNSDIVGRFDMPVVLVDRYYPELAIDAVLPDSFGAAYQVTELLISNGHQRIAVVWGETACTSVADSLAGYRRAFFDQNLPVSSDLATLQSYDSLSHRARLATLGAWLGLSDPPTAYLASNAHTLSILVTDLVTLGLKPTDLVLGSFGNDNPEALTALGATSGILPSRRIGRKAAKLLFDRIGGRSNPPETVVLPIEVVSGTRVRSPATR